MSRKSAQMAHMHAHTDSMAVCADMLATQIGGIKRVCCANAEGYACVNRVHDPRPKPNTETETETDTDTETKTVTETLFEGPL